MTEYEKSLQELGRLYAKLIINTPKNESLGFIGDTWRFHIYSAMEQGETMTTTTSKVLSQDQVDELLKPDLKVTRTDKIGEECLTKALEIINGNRRDAYGGPKESFDRVCEYWNSYLHHVGKLNDSNLFISDVAMMMILFKIAREENKHKHDNLVDICGYAAILDHILEEVE